MRKSDVIVGIVLLAVMTLALAACAAGGVESAATNPEPTNTPEPALDTANPVEEADEATTGQIAPAGGAPEAEATVEITVEEAGAAFTGTKVVTGSVAPVVVDLGEITPDAAESTDGELKEMPAPGVPNPEVNVEQKAKMDLAQRLNVDVGDIIVVENKEMQWPSSALGCPEEGMAYLQVITSGFKITLEANGEQYIYHTNQGEKIVLCGADGHPVK